MGPAEPVRKVDLPGSKWPGMSCETQWILGYQGQDMTMPLGAAGSSSVRLGARKVDQMEGGSAPSVKCESDLALSLGQS